MSETASAAGVKLARSYILALKKQIKLALDEEWREFGGRQGKLKHLAVDLLAHADVFNISFFV